MGWKNFHSCGLAVSKTPAMKQDETSIWAIKNRDTQVQLEFNVSTNALIENSRIQSESA
jgi:hypothetical protein